MNKRISDITHCNDQSTELESYHLSDEKLISGNPLQSMLNHFESPCEQCYEDLAKQGQWLACGL